MIKSKNQPVQPWSLARSVLYTLGQLTSNVTEFTYNTHRFRSAYAKGGMEYARLIKHALNEKAIRQTINDLRKRQYIKTKRLGKKLIISVADKGKLAILRSRLKQIKPSDGICTVVVFDIPESASSARRQFRRWLKDCHFKMLQRSVWITDRDVAALINKAINQLHLPGWIITLTTLTPIVYKSYHRLQ
ncbi:MAG: hypothetical protein V1712_04005 [Patescibacteria group bacterium]